MTGDSNAILINSRPAFTGEDRILLHFREVDGKPADIRLGSKIDNRPIKNLKEVNVIGEEIKSLEKSISFKPFEVKFIEVQF